MAYRKYFRSTPENESIFEEHLCEFRYYSGFSIMQKQKCIIDLHDSIRKIEKNAEILEISTKSTEDIGVKLSAFNLRFFDEYKGSEFRIENIFQSAKVFQNGGPYLDLLYMDPKKVKKDDRLKNSGKLVHFKFQDKTWGLEPKTMFYDWLYIKALQQNAELSNAIMNYNIFTDIEFNHARSINCQARAAAIFVSLSKMNRLEQVLEDNELLREVYDNRGTGLL